MLIPSYAYAADWYDSDWDYAKKITVDSSQVDATLTDFPILVNYTSSDVGTNAQSDCDDILFTDNTNVTKYSHEIENCDLAANDWFTAWVKIPSVSSSTDTDLFMYYGNNAASSQEDVSNTWNSNFEAVYHLHDDFLDSTSNSFDGTNNGSTDFADEHIADSQSFDGTNDYIDDDIATFPISTYPFTLTCWCSIDTEGNNGLVWIGDKDATNIQYQIRTISDSGLKFRVSARDGSSPANGDSTNTFSLDTWYYVTGVFRSATDRELFVNGVSEATNTSTITPTASFDRISIGRAGDNPSPGIHADGKIDEARFLSVGLSNAWITAEYDNQKSGSTFLTIGAQGTEPSAGGTSHTWNITDELGLDDSVSFSEMNNHVWNITDELGLDDSVSFSEMNNHVWNITDELGLDDTGDFALMGNHVWNITDELGLDDSVEFLSSSHVWNIVDELGLDDSVSFDLEKQIFNALRLSLNTPTDSRLGGVYSGLCDFANNYTMIGIHTNGTIACAQWP